MKLQHSLVPDPRSQMDGRTWSPHNSLLFCFVQNVNKQQHVIYCRRKLGELSERVVSSRCIADSWQRPLYCSKSTNTRCFLAFCLRWALWPAVVNQKVWYLYLLSPWAAVCYDASLLTCVRCSDLCRLYIFKIWRKITSYTPKRRDWLWDSHSLLFSGLRG